MEHRIKKFLKGEGIFEINLDNLLEDETAS
jgi:hypothetical protein